MTSVPPIRPACAATSALDGQGACAAASARPGQAWSAHRARGQGTRAVTYHRARRPGHPRRHIPPRARLGAPLPPLGQASPGPPTTRAARCARAGTAPTDGEDRSSSTLGSSGDIRFLDDSPSCQRSRRRGAARRRAQRRPRPSRRSPSRIGHRPRQHRWPARLTRTQPPITTAVKKRAPAAGSHEEEMSWEGNRTGEEDANRDAAQIWVRLRLWIGFGWIARGSLEKENELVHRAGVF